VQSLGYFSYDLSLEVTEFGLLFTPDVTTAIPCTMYYCLPQMQLKS